MSMLAQMMVKNVANREEKLHISIRTATHTEREGARAINYMTMVLVQHMKLRARSFQFRLDLLASSFLFCVAQSLYRYVRTNVVLFMLYSSTINFCCCIPFFAVRLFINKCYVVLFFVHVLFVYTFLQSTDENWQDFVQKSQFFEWFFFLCSTLFFPFRVNLCAIVLYLYRRRTVDTEVSIHCTWLKLKCEDIHEVNCVNSMIVLIIIVIVWHDSNSKMVIKHAHFTGFAACWQPRNRSIAYLTI